MIMTSSTAPDISVYPLWYYQRGLLTRDEYEHATRSRRHRARFTAELRRFYAERYAAKHGGVWCAKHGFARITDSGAGTGFAGGYIYWAQLSCGCWDTDEAGDVRAAR